MNSSTHDIEASVKTYTIKEFESLRGYMALWVVIGHSILQFPDDWVTLPVFNYLLDPGIAVSVFIILSGFVIFYLLDSKKEQFYVFLIRRALRLFPVYLFVLLISVLMFHSTLNLLSDLSDRYPDTKHLINSLRIFRATGDYYWENILSHIFLFQGVIPEAMIPEGQYAFVGQAWSLTLEWQFYIVAPIFISMIYNQNEYVKLLLPTSLMGLYLLFRDLNFSFIFGYKLVYFIIGGGSYYLWKNLIYISEIRKMLNLSFFLVVLLTMRLIGLELPDIIWVFVFFTALSNYLDCQNLMTRFASFFLLNPVARFFGKISYSLYLNHIIVIYGSLMIIQSLDENFLNIGDSAFLVSLFAGYVVFVTVLMSAVTYQYIEKPFIDLGKRCFAKNDQTDVVIEKG